MSRAVPTLSLPALAVLVTGMALAGTSSAWAQSSGCQDAATFLNERKNLVEQLTALGKKNKGKLDPRAACSVFTKLVSNGEMGMKWLEANKDWCQVPDQFATNFKNDHARAVTLKGQACQAAAQISQMEKKARQQAQQGGPALLGGGGLTGEYKIPQGAL